MMKVVLLVLCFIALFLQQQVDAAHVVFVHGLVGFGPTELFGINYWGYSRLGGPLFPNLMCVAAGCQSYSHDNCGSCQHTYHYASVGPISGNWYRACELYAQIKGTRVDYGKKHAERGHERFGKDYTGQGFYPEWDNNHPISLVGHSMGGQTIRMLERLLQEGSSDEQNENYADMSPLFQGGNTKMIRSVHTLATPFNGSPLVEILGAGIVDIIKDVLFFLGSAAELFDVDFDWLYDFDLDHWTNQLELQGKESGESQKDYITRIADFWITKFSDPNFRELADYDMSVEFAYEFNSGGPQTYPDTYYFAHSTSQSSGCIFNWFDQCMDADTEVVLTIPGNLIGACDNQCGTNVQCNGEDWCNGGYGQFCWNDKFEKNDGLVPRRSGRGPEIGVPKNQYITPASRDDTWVWTNIFFGQWKWTWQKNRWYERYHERDHLQIVGQRLNPIELDATDDAYHEILEELNYVWA